MAEGKSPFDFKRLEQLLLEVQNEINRNVDEQSPRAKEGQLKTPSAQPCNTNKAQQIQTEEHVYQRVLHKGCQDVRIDCRTAGQRVYEETRINGFRFYVKQFRNKYSVIEPEGTGKRPREQENPSMLSMSTV